MTSTITDDIGFTVTQACQLGQERLEPGDALLIRMPGRDVLLVRYAAGALRDVRALHDAGAITVSAGEVVDAFKTLPKPAHNRPSASLRARLRIVR